jgi:hypothetical protein
VHFHTLVLDGVFVREPDGTLRFHPAVPPTDDDVRWVIARVRRRLERLGLVGVTAADEDTAGHYAPRASQGGVPIAASD